MIQRNIQLYKFSLYGFLKNLRFFEPFMILFLLEKGLTFTQVGLLYGFREIIINILEVPTGIFADSIGLKKTMVLSFCAYIVSFFVFFISSHVSLLLAAMVFFSFGEACRTGTHKAMIFEYLRQNDAENIKTAYYGYTRSWSQMGSAVSALIAGIIVFWQGSYSSIFLFSIIPYVMDLFLIMSYPNSLDGKTQDTQKKLTEAFKDIIKEIRFIFSSKKTFITIGNLAVHSGLYKAGKDFIQPILRTLALSIPILISYSVEQRSSVTVGIVYFLLYLITSFASRSSHIFVEKTKSASNLLNISLIAGAVTACAAGLIYKVGIIPIAVFLYILIFVFENIRKPAGVAYISDSIKPKAIATTLSAVSQASSIITAGISFCLGIAIDHLGIGWGMASVFGLVGILSLFLMLPKENQN